MAKNSAGQEVPEIPQCSCGKQNSAGQCEHVRPMWAAPAPAPVITVTHGALPANASPPWHDEEADRRAPAATAPAGGAREFLLRGGGGSEGGEDGIRACTISAEHAIELMDAYAAELERRLNEAVLVAAAKDVQLKSAERRVEELVRGKEPNGYPLWFNREVHECRDCDSEDLCNRHLTMAQRGFADCDAHVQRFVAALRKAKEQSNGSR